MRSAPNEIEAWLSACPAEHTNYAKHWLLALCDATNSTQSQSVVQLTFKNQQDINHHVSPRALCAAAAATRKQLLFQIENAEFIMGHDACTVPARQYLHRAAATGGRCAIYIM